MSLVIQHSLRSNRDERGFSWFPFQDVPGIGSVSLEKFHYAELIPGAIRGKHYHPSHTEYIMVSGTSIKLIFENLSGDQEILFYEKSPNILFEVLPNIKHTIKNTGSGINHLIGFFSGKGKVETIHNSRGVIV